MMKNLLQCVIIRERILRFLHIFNDCMQFDECAKNVNNISTTNKLQIKLTINKKNFILHMGAYYKS